MDAVDFPIGLWSTDAQDLRDDALLKRGVLTFDGDSPLELDILPGYLIDYPSQSFENGLVVNYTDEGLCVDQVFARALDGSYYILRDVLGSPPALTEVGYSGQHLRGQTLLVTQQLISPNPLIRELHVKFPGLREWVGRQCFVVEPTVCSETRSGISFSSDDKDLVPITLFKNERLKVSIGFEPTVSGLIGHSYRFSYEVDCSLCLEFLGECPSLDEALSEWMHRTVDFLSYCMGFKRSITEVVFVTKEGVKGSYYAPLSGTKGSASYYETHHMPFQLTRIEDRTQEMLGSWYGFEGYARNASKLVVSLMNNWRMPIDMVFLMSAQALEAFSRVEVDELELPEDEFNNKLEKIRQSDMNRKTKDWVLYKLRGSNWKDAGRLRDDLLKRLNPLTGWLIPDEPRFKNDHRECRNAYTHRRDMTVDGQLNARELWAHTGAVRLLCYGAVSLLMGITPVEVVRAFEETRYCETEVLSARKLYAAVNSR